MAWARAGEPSVSTFRGSEPGVVSTSRGADMAASDRFRTHEVENQVPALGAYNAFLADTALREAVAREGGGWAETELTRFGEVAGGEMIELGFAANENRPRL